jgi:hypothetical protein
MSLFWYYRVVTKIMEKPAQLQLPFPSEELAAGMGDLLRNAEGAKLLEVAPRTLRQYRLEGKIPASKYGRNSFRFLKRDLINFMKSNYGYHTNLN